MNCLKGFTSEQSKQTRVDHFRLTLTSEGTGRTLTLSHAGGWDGGGKQQPLTADADSTWMLWTEVPMFITKIQVFEFRRPQIFFCKKKRDKSQDPQKSILL